MACKTCENYDYQGDNVKGYCDYYRCYYYPTDNCSHYKNAESTSTCYVTTVVCDILGYGDNCGVLNTLRDLRYTMQDDKKYAGLLYEYDTVGPKIAKDIKEEYNKTKDEEMWIQFFNFYIQKSASLYSEGKTEEAVIRYKEMFMSLKEYYGYKELPYIIPQDYDLKNSGHGKVKTIGIHPSMRVNINKEEK